MNAPKPGPHDQARLLLVDDDRAHVESLPLAHPRRCGGQREGVRAS